MIIKLGFSESWIKLVMLCVKLANYSILINGEPKGYIKPSWGLRQGNPLSPYLFLICTEGLISFLSKATIDCSLTGIWIYRGALAISHILFVDDSIYIYIYIARLNYWKIRLFSSYWRYMRKLLGNKSIE